MNFLELDHGLQHGHLVVVVVGHTQIEIWIPVHPSTHETKYVMRATRTIMTERNNRNSELYRHATSDLQIWGGRWSMRRPLSARQYAQRDWESPVSFFRQDARGIHHHS